MKSTGLFGKNSGRVGGVVYSNYRGVQVVRSYQPKVANPQSALQVAQRAKFKLVSQVGASLGREINMSFVPTVQKETPRNAFIKKMLPKTTYRNHMAALPLEEIKLTNSHINAFTEVEVNVGDISGVVDLSMFPTVPCIHVVQIGSLEGGEIVVLSSFNITDVGEEGNFVAANVFRQTNQYTMQRVLLYAVALDGSDVSFSDYVTAGQEAELEAIMRELRNELVFSDTYNTAKPLNV